MPFRLRTSRTLLAVVAACVGFLAVQADAAEMSLVFRDVEPTSVVRFVPSDDEKRVPRSFRLKGHEFEAISKTVDTVGAVRSYDVRFPSPLRSGMPKNDVVHGRYFQPAGDGPFPGCVLLHELDGQFWLVHMVADLLARRGVATLAIAMPYYGDRRDPESHRRMVSLDPRRTVDSVHQAVYDVRRSASWLSARPEVADDRMGLAGISLGGFVAGVAAAAEPKFSHVAIILAGGNVTDLVWDHDNHVAGVFRDQWTKAGGNRESLRRVMEPVEPTTHAHLLKDREVLMIAATKDEIVPRAATMSLYQSLDERPELVWLEAGHITAAFYFRQEIDRLGRFFKAAR